MNHRTYGETKNCKGCRYWSEMIAQSQGSGGVEALCLAPAAIEAPMPDAPFASKYTRGSQTCDAWASGHHGAVDEPPDYGEAVRALYAEEAHQGVET